jgi:hypothetical protein
MFTVQPTLRDHHKVTDLYPSHLGTMYPSFQFTLIPVGKFQYSYNTLAELKIWIIVKDYCMYIDGGSFHKITLFA